MKVGRELGYATLAFETVLVDDVITLSEEGTIYGTNGHQFVAVYDERAEHWVVVGPTSGDYYGEYDLEILPLLQRSTGDYVVVNISETAAATSLDTQLVTNRYLLQNLPADILQEHPVMKAK